MTTYTDEVNVYNPEAIASGIAEAGRTATNYLTTVDQSGLMVHPSSDSTSGWKISSAIELLKSGMSFMKLWLEDNVAKIRIGKAGESRMELDYRSMKLVDMAGTTYLYVSDVRGQDGFVTDTFVGDGNTDTFRTSSMPNPDGTAPIVVTFNGATVQVGMVWAQNTVKLGTVPGNGVMVAIRYEADPEKSKAYTLGVRKSGEVASGGTYAEGYDNVANGIYSHAEGQLTESSSFCSHSEGYGTTASGESSHSEGSGTTASGKSSHSEGSGTTASGEHSHAEGVNSKASGYCSHAQNATDAESDYQTTIGKYNVKDTSGAYAFIIGNGTAPTENLRSNAFSLDWFGNGFFAGDVEAANVGVVKTADISSNVSVATGTNKSIGSVSLEAGKWVISFGASYSANATGSRSAWIDPHQNTSGSAQEYRESLVQSPACNGQQTYVRGSCIVEPSSTTTYYLTLWQNSGSSLSCQGNIKAIRIK